MPMLLGAALTLAPLSDRAPGAPGEQVIMEIQAPQKFHDAAFELKAGDASVHSSFDSHAFAKIGVELPRRSHLTLTLTIVDSYEAPPPWVVETTLNGSGRLVWTLNRDAPIGSVSQWPSVTWAATGARLDVAVDGHVTGTTTTSDGIEPDRQHAVVWRSTRGRHAAVCSRAIRLPPNVERTYTCDVKSRAVSEE
jgi:hypothetical protein